MAEPGSAVRSPGVLFTLALRGYRPAWTAVLSAAICLLALAGAPGAHAEIEGFGTSTPGGSCGSGGAVYTVNSLANDGDGSLRQAVSAGNRCVVFSVSGQINLTGGPIRVSSFITIDGSTAPSPGITLDGSGLILRDVNDVIVRGLRIRNVQDFGGLRMDGIQINGARNVAISNVSVWAGPDQTSGDGLIDITAGSRDVTVAWSILGGSGKAMLIKYDAARVTLHHNIWAQARNRNPQVSQDDAGTPATDTTVDMRNNIVYDWIGGSGTTIHHGARANLIANFYSSPNDLVSDQEQAIIVCQGTGCFDGDPSNSARAFTEGNVSGDFLTVDINTVGTESAPFAAAPVTTDDACTGARDTLAGAGARPLDAIDQQFLAPITLPICRRTTAAMTATDSPTTLGQPITFTATVQARPPAVGAPRGSVTFFEGSVAMKTVPLVDGQATMTTRSLPQGTTTVTAAYSGDPDFDASQVSLKHKVVGAPTSTTLAASPNPAHLGTPVTLTATVIAQPPSTATPEGSVRFYNGTQILATKPLTGGVATLVTSTLPAGVRTMKAQFLGNTAFAGSTSLALSLRIDGGTATSLTRTPSSAYTGQPVTFTARVTSLTGDVAPAGTVSFRSGTALLADPVPLTVVNGTATAVLTTSTMSIGKHSVTATYNGSASFEPSVSSALTTSIVKGGTKTTLASTLLTFLLGQRVTFTAVVTAVAPATGTPGGSLRFRDGAATLGTVPLSGGTAQFSTQVLGAGTHSITAAYDDSSQFKSSLSNKLTIQVTVP